MRHHQLDGFMHRSEQGSNPCMLTNLEGGLTMARKKRRGNKRNEKMHNVSSSPEKAKVFVGRSIEGIAIYVWKAIPKGYEHDLS